MYKSQLLNGYSRYYDTFESTESFGFQFDFSAKYNQRNSKYMAVKKLEYYAFSNFEEVYYKHFENFDTSELSEMTKFVDAYLEEFQAADETHMETLLTVIISSNVPVSSEVKKALSKLNPSKSLKWGFNGWVKVKLILIDSNEEIITNKFGRVDQTKLLKLIS